jgi:hypothetical protein
MKKWLFSLLMLQALLCSSWLLGQTEEVRPQLWNNLLVGWEIDDHFRLRGELSYNVLITDTVPWSELTSAASGVYRFHRFMETSAGFYFSAANQNEDLRSLELRPFMGFTVFTNNSKRWMVSNFSKLEIRTFRYSDLSKDIALRFRNRTYAIVSLNKRSILEDRNVMLFGYFEAFYNFEKEVRERFFNQFKYKLGFGYRHNFSWRVTLGMIYQDARNNVEQPDVLPISYKIVTNWVIEWGVAYIIPQKARD